MRKKKISEDYIEKQIIKDPKLRRELIRKSLYWFFTIYLSDYIKYPTADFQKQMFDVAQDDEIKSAVITAFRGSGKSTIMSLTYPIWAMVTGLKKFIIILSQNQSQSMLILSNIRAELEKNKLLISDFGPFKQITDEWSQHALLVNAYNCRIACISSGESIRGIRYKENRPDLIIFDDVEDLQSTRTKEARDKTFNLVTREVIPAGDLDTKIVIIGNKLHEDGLMMRLKRAIEDNAFKATYMEYPLLDETGSCLWPQKFPIEKQINDLKSSVVSEASWQREYLLKIVPEDDAVILPDWIKYYDSLPPDENLRYTAVGIDLAISKSSTADYTAMVAAKVYGYDSDLKIYILPHPVNLKLNFPETVEKAKLLSDIIDNVYPAKLFIEDVGYQGSLIQELSRQGYPAEGIKPYGQDKKARLTLTTPLLKIGNILFPKKGCEDLISQLTGFGFERHDDLADAFAILILKICQKSRRSGVTFFTLPMDRVEI